MNLERMRLRVKGLGGRSRTEETQNSYGDQLLLYPSQGSPTRGQGMSKWETGQTSQEVCPWNISFAAQVREPAFAPRDVIADKDLRTLAQDILAMDHDGFRAAFKGSAMKRAKLAGLQRNAALVLGAVS